MNISCTRWLSILNTIIKKCFKKIRITKEKINPELEKLFEKKEELKTFIALHDDTDNAMESNKKELEDV